MDLLAFIKENKGKVFLDGGMGTQLDAHGAPMGGTACLTNLSDVLAVHSAYAEAGAHILITNTLTMNRIHIDSHGMEIDVREVNLAGARLAKQAAVSGQFVLGDISTTGKMLKPLGDLHEEMAFNAFEEQAGYLAEGSVDGFIIETMYDLNETLIALRACKAAADLPVFASMTFETLNRGGRTIMGNSAADCATKLDEAGADVIGANCGSLSPVDMAEITQTMVEATGKPVVIQPNAGKPRLEGTTSVFDMPPDEFAAGILLCLENGASIVGGCCGTTPAHIKEISRLI